MNYKLLKNFRDQKGEGYFSYTSHPFLVTEVQLYQGQTITFFNLSRVSFFRQSHCVYLWSNVLLNALLAGSDSAQINNLPHTSSNVIVTQGKTSQVRWMYYDQHIENFYSPSADWLKNYTHEMGWFTWLRCLLARIHFCQSDSPEGCLLVE